MGCSMVCFTVLNTTPGLVKRLSSCAIDNATAAKHIQGISRKARIWNVLKDVEAETGYNTRATVKHLQDLVEQNP
jgi:hypothetical protein